MSEIVQRLIDQDVIERWTDETTGYACMMRSGPLDSISGYVAVPESHPWHGMHYNDAYCGHDGCYEHTPEHDIDIADTPTFGDWFDAIGLQWWFGFITGDFGIAPKDAAYVKAECAELARKLKAAEAAS